MLACRDFAPPVSLRAAQAPGPRGPTSAPPAGPGGWGLSHEGRVRLQRELEEVIEGCHGWVLDSKIRAVKPPAALRAVKILHTIVWGFFASCVVAIPVLGCLRLYRQAAFLAGVVLVEVFILLVNRFHTPWQRPV